MKHFIPKNFIIAYALCALLGNLAFAIKRPVQQAVTPLAQGTQLERPIKSGEIHSYPVHLSAGQYFYALIEQKGIDVSVSLFELDNQLLVSADSPNNSNGFEPLVHIAKVSGEFRLEIKANNNLTGQYALQVLALRPASAVDQEHYAAERNFAEAQTLRQKRTAATWRSAIEKYQQALLFYQASGNAERHALSLYIIGNCYANLGEFRQALGFLNQALPLFQQRADRSMEAVTLNFMGGAADVLGDLPQAFTTYQQALELARAVKDQSTEATLLNNLGKIYVDIAEWQKASDHFRTAIALQHALGSKLMEAQSLDNLGATLFRINDLAKALEAHQSALVLRRTGNDKAREALTLQRIGNVYAAQGEMAKAVAHYQQALAMQSEAGDRAGKAATLKQLGELFSTQGKPEQALEVLQQSIQLWQAIGDKRSEGLTHERFGATYAAMGQRQSALDHYTAGLTIFRAVGDRQNEAKTLQGMAQAERANGNLAIARQRIETALALYENVRTNVGNQQSRASYFAVQQTAYQFYTDLLMTLHQQNPSAGHNAMAWQVTERARARSLLELLAESKVDFRKGVSAQLLDREKDLMLQINAKAARLLQRNSADTIATLKKEISGLEDDYQQVQAAIRQSNPQYAAVTQPQPLKLAGIQQELDENTVLLEYALGEERSFVWAVTRDGLTNYELPKQAEIKPLAQQVYDALTARAVVVKLETAAAKRARVEQADAQFADASAKLSALVLAPLAAELGNKRLVIVADGALQYVPFAALPDPSVVPRQSSVATPKPNGQRTTDNAQPLIVNHEIITLPSASTIAILRQQLAGRPVAPKMLAVIADPVFQTGDTRTKARKVTVSAAALPAGETAARNILHTEENATNEPASIGGFNISRLPFTHQEADQIFALAPRGTSLRATDFKANRATVTDPALGQYRYLHFATHGLLDSERPGLSALVLSLINEQGKAEDGFLRAHELYNLKLPAELVVLSACQTGLGKEIKGEGLIGLSRGFMYAGAARVIMSLWSVNDKATADLMTAFYQKMLKAGEAPAAALRSAQIQMWQQKHWQAPYYWAAFTLQGEWR